MIRKATKEDLMQALKELFDEIETAETDTIRIELEHHGSEGYIDGMMVYHPSGYKSVTITWYSNG